MISGLAHVGICVPDLDQAVAWYSATLGLQILSPPHEMRGEQIEHDMGELLPSPVVVRAAILGTDRDDHVIELLEYPEARPKPDAEPDPKRASKALTDHRITHLGVVCDDVEKTRAELEARGVRFVVSGVARVAGLTTTWFEDPWGNTIILMAKRHPDRPYWRQYDL